MDPSAHVFEGSAPAVTAEVFLDNHYHQPSDDLNLPIDYEWAAKFVDVNLAIAKSIANTAQRPKWNEDSFFKTFAQ